MRKIPLTPFENTLDVVTNRMLSALSAYHIWKWLKQAININNEGGEVVVKRHLEIINRHNAVFLQIMVSTYKSFVADLSIFFDSNSYETFSLKKFIKAAKDGNSDIEFEGIEQKIINIKRERNITISFLNELRNADVAHQELESKARSIVFEEIEDLFLAVQEIINLISSEYNKSTSAWFHIEKEIDRQMEWIFNNLERGELIRLEEINNRYLPGKQSKPVVH